MNSFEEKCNNGHKNFNILSCYAFKKNYKQHPKLMQTETTLSVLAPNTFDS